VTATTHEQLITDLNYFNYFTELEEAFIRRRGKHLWLSPVDWALMESWKEMGVPLHVAIRGVERSFDSYEAKPRHRSVKSLMYCREEVEAQFAEWLEGQVGSETAAGDGTADLPQAGTPDGGLPFPRNAIRDHLERAQSALLSGAERLIASSDGDLRDCFLRTSARIKELEDDLMNSTTPDAQKLEESLTHLERMLNDSIRVHAPEEKLVSARSYTEEQLSSYRKRMDKATYEQTFDNLYVKQLREDYGLPRLSLFYL
jgi:hypothetical protein